MDVLKRLLSVKLTSVFTSAFDRYMDDFLSVSVLGKFALF